MTILNKLTSRINALLSNTKTLMYVLLLLVASITQSCDTEVPEVDNMPPKFSFKVTGDGFDRIFTQEDDFSNIQLNLRKGATYDFIFSGADPGGVELIQWQLPIDYIEVTSAFPGNWTMTNVSALSKMIQWTGDFNNAITASFLTGTFTATGEIVSISFGFFVKDFGGESRRSNTVSRDFNINIGTEDTETEVTNI